MVQTGEVIHPVDPPARFRPNSPSAEFIANLHKAGITNFVKYEEGECGFYAPWGFLVGFKDEKTLATWYQSSADVEMKLHQRATRTVNGELPFKNFDGATMMNYQYPSRVEEEVHCRNGWSECDSGHGFQPERSNAQLSSFEVRKTNDRHEFFAKEDLPAGSYIAANEAVHSLFVPPTSKRFLDRFGRSPHGVGRWGALTPYFQGIKAGGRRLEAAVPISIIRPSSPRNGTSPITYSPFQQRNNLVAANVDVTLSDVKAGDEISLGAMKEVASSLASEL